MKVEIELEELCVLKRMAAKNNKDAMVLIRQGDERVKHLKERLAHVCRRHNHMIRSLQGIRSCLEESDNYFVQFGDDGERVR